MPRPREHDPSKVRELAMHGFWKLGFSGATMSKLQETTGIDKKQLTRDYGSKKGLFLESLNDYILFIDKHILSGIASESAGLTEIQSTLKRLVDFSTKPEGRFGCLLCNSGADEHAMNDPQIAEVVRKGISLIESSYANALRQANKREEISITKNKIRVLSRSLMSAHVSIVFLLRLEVDKQLLKDIATQAIASLEAYK